MNLCGGYGRDRHDEVCYESNNCPVCAVQTEKHDLEKDLDAALTDRNDMEVERDKAVDLLEAYKTDVRMAVKLVREPYED